MPRASFRVLPFLLIVLGAGVALGAGGCAVDPEDDDAETGDDANLTEGSAEARAVLALVNAPELTPEELLREARVTLTIGQAIIVGRAQRPYVTLRQIDDVPGVGPATIKRLLEYAKRKGLYTPGSGGATEVIFSPAPAESSHLVRIAQEIDLAQESIDIALYSYSDAKIGEALTRAVARGIKVRFVFNDAPADARLPLASQPASKSAKLESSGINVRFINKIMHHKFMIVDGPRDAAARAKTARLVTGSANWSNSAARTFDENTVFFKGQEEIILRFQREFDTMWSRSRDFAFKDLPYELSTLSIQDSAIPDDANADALFTSANFSVRDTTFSNTGANTVSDALIAAINGATRSIHLATGHMRHRAIAEALIAKKQAVPALDVRMYLDGQEFIAKGTHDIQVEEVETCLVAAGDNARKKAACVDKNFLFGYQIGAGGIDVRYKYYAYRWNYSYAPQMHHKYMVIDGTTLYTGSYNLSDNAEHATFENMLMLKGAENAAVVAKFEANFESMWNTGRDENKLAALNADIEQPGDFPIVFDPMALTHAEVTALKNKIRAACPAIDSPEYRSGAASRTVCSR